MAKAYGTILDVFDRERADAFWALVKKRKQDQCWLWQGHKDTYTHCGRFFAYGRTWTAPRVAWSLFHREELGSRLACHRCDTPRCCNPHHIFAGTHKDNNIDTAAKGRHFNGHPVTRETGARKAKALRDVPTYLRSEVALALREAQFEKARQEAKRK